VYADGEGRGKEESGGRGREVIDTTVLNNPHNTYPPQHSEVHCNIDGTGSEGGEQWGHHPGEA